MQYFIWEWCQGKGSTSPLFEEVGLYFFFFFLHIIIWIEQDILDVVLIKCFEWLEWLLIYCYIDDILLIYCLLCYLGLEIKFLRKIAFKLNCSLLESLG